MPGFLKLLLSMKSVCVCVCVKLFLKQVDIVGIVTTIYVKAVELVSPII